MLAANIRRMLAVNIEAKTKEHQRVARCSRLSLARLLRIDVRLQRDLDIARKTALVGVGELLQLGLQARRDGDRERSSFVHARICTQNALTRQAGSCHRTRNARVATCVQLVQGWWIVSCQWAAAGEYSVPKTANPPRGRACSD